MSASAPSPTRLARRADCLVLLHEDVSPQLDRPVRELIRDGHRLQIESQSGRGPASFAVGDGLRLYGDGGILNSRTVRAVLERSIRDADHDFQLDLDGLDYLALMSWAVVLQATQNFRARGGTLHVHARRSTRRLLAMSTAIEAHRTNLDVT
jgi:hypothetical protein